MPSKQDFIELGRELCWSQAQSHTGTMQINFEWHPPAVVGHTWF